MSPAAPTVLLQVLPADPLLAFLLVLLIVAVPPVLFVVYLRHAERSRREPWKAVLKAFAWGATAGVVLAIVPQLLFQRYADGIYPWISTVSFATVVVAPVTEEIAKGLGLLFIRDADPEPEDGYVYGGAIGLGFAATENLLYVGVALLLQGEEVALLTAAYRGLVTVSLHGAASAIAGGGIWRGRWRRAWGAAAVALLLAIGIHAAYNAIVSSNLLVAALAAGIGAVYAFWRVRRRVKRLDRRAPAA